MIICVMDTFGPICIESEDGKKLFDHVCEILNCKETVCLDFTGITMLVSAFLNTAVGCLYGSFDKDDLARRFTWQGLDSTDEALLRLVQKNAIRFFSANQSQREALLASSLRFAGE
jgi:hypothetical protein